MKVPKIAVLASGDGSNFEALVHACRDGKLGAEISGLIANRMGIRALERAENLGVPRAVFVAKDFDSLTLWNQAIVLQLQNWGVEWVVLAGFTGLIGQELLANFPSRVVNSHPSLLPKFGGKGMYGIRVHEAVLHAGETESGITVHLLNERFDEGPILAQTRVPVEPGDTPKLLAERIKRTERKFYPEVLQELLTGRIKTR